MLSSSRVAVARNASRRLGVRRLATEPYVPPPPPPPPPAAKNDKSGALVFGLVAALAVGGGLAYAYQEQILDPRKAKNPADASEAIKKALADAKPIPAAKTTGGAEPKPVQPAPAGPVPTKPAAAAPQVDDKALPSKNELASLEKRLSHPGAPATAVDWAVIRERIVDLLDDDEWDDGSWGPVFVRLAWHASGTFDTTTGLGGSDGGLMRFAPESDWGANAGLAHPRARLDAIKKEFPSISYADLWTFAGATAIEEMGGPELKWRPGRRDMEAGTRLPDGLLPDADGRGEPNPVDHLRHIFGRMGFTDRDIVALSGAHALGRCHEDRSGYWGPWTRSPTTFSNTYFQHLLDYKWTHKKTHKGKAWTGPDQYEDPTGELMMLPTDLALIHDAKTRPIVEEYAKDEKKFFEDFVKAWTKLTELGVRKFHGKRRYWLFGPRE